jgi:hypothetical protein
MDLTDKQLLRIARLGPASIRAMRMEGYLDGIGRPKGIGEFRYNLREARTLRVGSYLMVDVQMEPRASWAIAKKWEYTDFTPYGSIIFCPALGATYFIADPIDKAGLVCAIAEGGGVAIAVDLAVLHGVLIEPTMAA